MASVFVLLEAFNRKEAAALGFFPCATASRKCNFSALAVGVVLRILGNLGHDVGITGQRVHDILDRGDAPKSFTVWRNI